MLPFAVGQDQTNAGDDQQRRQDIGEARADFGQRHRSEGGNDERGDQRESARGMSQDAARDPVDQRQIQSVNGAEQQAPVRRADKVAQEIRRHIGERIEEGLKAARRNVEIEASVQQRISAVLMVISPVPIDVFTRKIGVERACEQCAEDHGGRHKMFARDGHGSSVFRIGPIAGRQRSQSHPKMAQQA
ncbi:hypothetical protein [Bradyrhizobium sp. ARR65]|uniref:hypothetical protein n=1 Tax=Bradyrhizobium sp. ARR65 TaxID=1040989 RepID=UPI000B211EBC